MPDMFEIVDKDLMGRIGRFYTPHGLVETPTVMPVINPNLRLIEPAELRKYGAQMLITNSYIIYRTERLRQAALSQGLHSLLGFDGPIMTDSGSFQLSVYGSVEVDNPGIVGFERDIGADIGVPLDIPTPPDVSDTRAREELEITLARMAEAKQYAGKMLLAGPVQGSTHLAMREEAARRAYAIGFDVYPLGAVVPLMEAYRYSDLVDVIVRSKMGLGPDGIVHLFGAGHPMMLAMAVALGCDLFDSAAYALYAKDGRYMTVDGTFHIGQLQHLPCACPICSRHSAKEIAEADEATKTKLIAEHNLYVTFAELRLIKQSIIDGDLMEHVERRCHSHPRMLEGLQRMMDYAPYIERFDRASKSTFFYLGPESARRPEVLQFSRQINNIEVGKNALIATTRDVDTSGFDRVLGVKMPFGVFPPELNETYPVGHAEVIENFDSDARDLTLERILSFIKAHPGSSFTFAYDHRWESLVIDEIAKYAEVRKLF